MARAAYLPDTVSRHVLLDQKVGSYLVKKYTCPSKFVLERSLFEYLGRHTYFKIFNVHKELTTQLSSDMLLK